MDGMTDKQYKCHLRSIIYSLKLALEISPDNKVIQEMIAMYQQSLED